MVNGKLHVTIGGCRKLKDTETFGKMDPYVIIRIGGQKNRTKTKENAGRSPVFNESFKFDIIPSTNPVVSFEVMDSDVGKDDFVGGLECNFGEMATQGRTIDGWYGLKRKSGKPAGEIQIKLQFQPLAASAPTSYPAAPYPSGYPASAPPAPGYPAPPPPLAYSAPSAFPAPPPPAYHPAGYPAGPPPVAPMGYPAGYPPPQYGAAPPPPMYASAPMYGAPQAPPVYGAFGPKPKKNKGGSGMGALIGGAALGLGLGMALGGSWS
eukprot:CAMPEP_0184657288 /NCGR_PEP_ID=MMETSP0308-20130426/18399_1 /TAXON_ID=38269 /ORGANISM="Gloeochaete witrockiana, Strain SAG 46.84" /LENGTH=264 /DNA_ID=CAMNT_0027094953 /DNA_START=199 /DNA_END=996 /DNA_ORIENTATION=+